MSVIKSKRILKFDFLSLFKGVDDVWKLLNLQIFKSQEDLYIMSISLPDDIMSCSFTGHIIRVHSIGSSTSDLLARNLLNLKF